MVLTLAFVLSLAVVGRTTRKVADANTALVEASIAKDRATSELMQRQDEFTIGVIAQLHERSWTALASRDVHAAVRQRGLLPFLMDADSMLHQEIAAVQKQLGLSREDAVEFIRSRIPSAPPEPASASNGRRS